MRFIYTWAHFCRGGLNAISFASLDNELKQTQQQIKLEKAGMHDGNYWHTHDK